MPRSASLSSCVGMAMVLVMEKVLGRSILLILLGMRRATMVNTSTRRSRLWCGFGEAAITGMAHEWLGSGHCRDDKGKTR